MTKDLTLLTELHWDLGSLLGLKGVAADFSVGFDEISTGIFGLRLLFLFSSSGFVGTLLGFLPAAEIVHFYRLSECF